MKDEDAMQSLYCGPDVDSALPLQDRVALRLGRLTMRFAAAESLTRWFMLRAMGLEREEDPRMLAILGELSFRKLRAALLGVIRNLDDQDGSRESLHVLRPLLAKLAKLEERRNVFIHSAWVYSDLPRRMVREKHHVTGSGALRNDEVPLESLAELDEVIAELDDVIGSLAKWYMRLHLRVAT